MKLIWVKICVAIGLLLTTFAAACLPLVLLLRYLKGSGNQPISSWLPCLSWCCKTKDVCSNSQKNSEEHQSESTDENEGKSRKFKMFLNLMNCFSGGVFLGTSFLALMPEIRGIFDDVGVVWPKFHRSVPNSTSTLDEESSGTLMPITEILVTSGLFLILCVEQVVHSYMDIDKHIPERKVSDEISMDGVNIQNATIKVTVRDPTSDKIENEIVVKEDFVVDAATSVQENSTLLTCKSTDAAQSEHHDDSSVRSAILLFILSLHSALEGLAIGLQSKTSNTLSIFFAVLFHKSLMSFSMGNNLVQSGQSVKYILIAAAIFSFMSPVGIGIGILMKETNSGTEVAQGILQGIATGTFLFITFFEVLSKEFTNHSHRIYKSIAFILGYLCILAVMFAQHGG